MIHEKDTIKSQRKSFEDYKKFFSLSLDMLCIAGVDGYFKTVNSSFERVLGYTEQELLERSFLEFVHPDDVMKTREEIVKLDQGQPAIQFENRYKCKDGRYKWLSWNSSPGEGGIIYAVARDVTEQKLLEEDFRKNQSFLDSIVDNIPNMLFVKDAKDLRFVRFNKAGEELLGYSREEMIGKSDYDFFPKDEADFFTQKDREVLQGKKLIDITEEDIQTKSKGQRFLHTKKIPVYDQNGNPEYLLGISEDITDAKKAREALYESEKKYRDIVHLIQEGIWVIDAQNRTTFVNEEMAKMLGYECSEMEGKHMHDFMDEDGWAIAEKNIKRQKTGINEKLDFKLKTKSGEDRWTIINASPINDELGNYIGAIAAVVDVTQRRKNEELLKESEQRLSEAQKIANVGSWEFDAATKKITWSEETFRIFGLDKVSGEPGFDEFGNLIHPDDRDTLSQAVDRALNKGIPYELELKYLRPDKTIRYLLARGKPVMKNSEVVKLIGTALDVTDRRIAEAKIMKALVQGQDMERKRISEDLHDSLGQKLSAIKLNCSGIEKESYKFNAEAVMVYKTLQNQLNEAIEELRNICHNLMPPTLQDFGLVNALSDLCDKISGSGTMNIHFQVHGKAVSPSKEIEMALYRIAQELVNNALKHSKSKELNVQLFYHDDSLLLSAEDEGVGFDPRKKDFEMTFGINSITSRVKALDGIFTLESQPKKGTLVQVEIPL